jgi:DNA-binding CsgD family transcriptional regulator
MALMTLSAVADAVGDHATAVGRAEEALALFQALGYSAGVAMALGALARIALARGDDRRAALAYREGLRLWTGVGERWQIVRLLTGVAALAAATGQPEPAVTLLGAVDALLGEADVLLFPENRGTYDRTAATARAVLGTERFADAYAAGRKLRLEEALAVATLATVPAVPAGVAGKDRPLPAASGLTAREHDVLRLLVEGRSNTEIAHALYIGVRTARAHVASILAKLGVPTRTAAATHAVRHGLI